MQYVDAHLKNNFS